MSVYILSIYTPSAHVRMNMTANIHIDLTYVCVYFGRVFTRSSPVCVYMFPCIHAEVHTVVCVCVYGYVYTQRVYTWVVSSYVFTYIHTEFTSVCVYILQADTHEVVMCVDRCCTRSSHVCGHIYLYTRWVYLYIFTYMRTEFTCVGICLHICT